MMEILTNLLLVMVCSCSPAILEIPPDMRSGQVTLTNTSQPNSPITLQASITYSSSAFSSTPRVVWGVNGMDYTPSPTYFYYQVVPGPILTTGITFNFIIGSGSIRYLSAHYIAFDYVPYIETKPTSPTSSLGMNIHAGTKTFTGDNTKRPLWDPAYRGTYRRQYLHILSVTGVHNMGNVPLTFYFITGIRAYTIGALFEIDIQPYTDHSGTTRHHVVYITVGPDTTLVSFSYAMVYIDDFESSIMHDQVVSFNSVVFQYGVPSGQIPVFDLATTAYILGITRYTIESTSPFYFDFKNDPPNDVPFSSSLRLNAITYLTITKVTCPPAQNVNIARKECYTHRNGCPYDYQILPVSEIPTSIIFHSSNSLMAVVLSRSIQLYQYDLVNQQYSLYYAFLAGKDAIIGAKWSQDFSSLFLYTQTQIQIYGWSEGIYKIRYEYSIDKGFLLQIFAANINNDGTKIVWGGKISNIDDVDFRYLTVVLSYNATTGSYTQISQIKASLPYLYTFIDGEDDKLVIVERLTGTTYQKNPGSFYYQPIASNQTMGEGWNSMFIFKVIASTDGKVIAIMTYFDSSTNYQSHFDDGIRLLQYDQTLGYHTFLQFIRHHFNTGKGGGMSLNQDGTVLALQHNSNVMSVQSVWKRSSTADLFQMDQVLSSRTLTTDVDLYTTRNKVTVGLSPDGKIIAGLDQANTTDNKIIIYACHLDIQSYVIPEVSEISFGATQTAQIDFSGAATNDDEESQDTLKSVDSAAGALTSFLILQGVMIIGILVGGLVLVVKKYLFKKGNVEEEIKMEESIEKIESEGKQDKKTSFGNLVTIIEEQPHQEINEQKFDRMRRKKQRKVRKGGSDFEAKIEVDLDINSPQ